MLIGLMRPVEVQSVSVEGTDLADIQAQLEAQRPEGFDIVSSPVEMIKGAAVLKAVGTFARRDQVTEVEAEDLDALLAKVPDGWQLLNVRKA
ncbi:hypothetical protein [Microbacterium hydrocarbonoxydans]|uniref:hypothetical protein n=1 Tax=Microbacterium hydrocarbonoxydans TaxID=273678 RepID=UPI0007BBC203|nr:hypothetical protein [Microbacterium hydrocarbonoxydans]GAT74713.1 hypothetical protein MHM582_3219 [Microbacterium sp. HM58-2]